MATRRIHMVRSIACALACTLACAYVPAIAAAKPTAKQIEEKKAEQEAVNRELLRLQDSVAQQMAEYIVIGREIDRTRADVIDATARLSQVESQLASLKQALEDRAIELYRTDRVGMIEVFFTATSFSDLLDRASYLSLISQRDAQLVSDMRVTQSESLWLQQSLEAEVAKLQELQNRTDEQRSRIETDLAKQQAKAAEIGADLAAMMRAAVGGGTAGGPTGDFNPDMVISESQFRATSSMSVEEIQAFLDGQPGALKSLRTKDHAGVVKTAAQMVFEAAQRYNVSPKVILVTLQKEQSLLSRPHPSRRALDWAMGCGKTDSRTFTQYQGFGKQVWWGAQKLDKNSKPWYAGIQRTIDGSVVRPANAGTYSLYKYTPHFRGNMSFWMLYWRYFGDPLV